MASLACPICNNPFPSSQIADHVNRCLDGEPAPTEVPMQIDTPTGSAPVSKEEEDLAKLQEEEFLFWQKKREQEAEDARMATQLNSQTSTATTTPSFTKLEKTTEPVLRDSDLAKKLYEEEQNKQQLDNDRDRKLAEELWAKEEEAVKKKRMGKIIRII
eukprot:TRINITY_DN686_c0_g1_i2.p2 TRINITY_DN686_c0_g1~~TRINITY_DN686_c0_g1_i2.p2  ORF type:complete len:184 (-),score=67.63 TRINITY_DN686_c0_g1_i2:722-1198(-)